MIVEVLLEIKNLNLNKTFDYLVPQEFQDKIKVGLRVKVEFGKKLLEGFVMKIKKNSDFVGELKNIDSLVDEEIILNKELLELGNFMAQKYYASLSSCYDAMLPKAYKLGSKKINIKYKKEYYLLKKDYCSNIKSQQLIIDFLKNNHSLDELNYSKSSLKALIKNKVIEEKLIEDSRIKHEIYQKEVFKLTDNQERIFQELIKNKGFNTYLLHGVTGSGKTLIYLTLINYFAKTGKTAILLVPEISLTVQTVDYFKNYFDYPIAVLHSKLSEGERYDEYRKIKNGQIKVVIGARSAIFAPLKNIGIIIIDEEHSGTYKQDNNPKYNALEIAEERSRFNNSLLLLGSATPSLISYAKAIKGLYRLLNLPERINKSLPKIKIVNMEQEKSRYHFSKLLIDKINDRLIKKEQVILLLNRKGYATFASCNNCGTVYKCPNCDISLTYYKTSNLLRCNYCGYQKPYSNICYHCHEKGMTTLGVGTEKIEEELNKLFPKARVLRMDMDTTSLKNNHERIINDFKNYKADILLGTQMIAKGLDFPLVTLVGIINADTSLMIPNYKASEDTFSLLSQVSGRSGRGSKLGEVIIQTYNPDHYAIKLVKDNDYLTFFKKEMAIRRKLQYPPYYFLTHFKISSPIKELTNSEALKIKNYLIKSLEKTSIVLGPTIVNNFKLKNRYYLSIIIKYKKDKYLDQVIIDLLNMYKSNNKVKVDININPNFIR